MPGGVRARYLASGWDGILPLALESKRLPGSWRAPRGRWGKVKWIGHGIHSDCLRIMVEPWSRRDLENTKKVMWCLSESTRALCLLGLKFGLDFQLDPNGQGTRGSFFRSEMPFGELGVWPVALDSAWGPGSEPRGWLG